MIDRASEDEVSVPDTGATAGEIRQTPTEDVKADDVDADDPRKVEKLANAGRDSAPSEASE